MQNKVIYVPNGKREPEQPGEWLEEKNPWGGVRRYRKIGSMIEYEKEIMVNGIPVPESQLEEHNRRMKEAEEQYRKQETQRLADSAPLKTECPFLCGKNQLYTQCRRDCTFYGENGCEFCFTATEPTQDNANRECPLRGKCNNNCTMYSNGCGLLEFIKYIKKGRNLK